MLIFLACLTEMKGPKSLKKSVMWSLMLMETLFGGLRWQFGGDWDQFYYHFQHTNWSNIFNYVRNSAGRYTKCSGK